MLCRYLYELVSTHSLVSHRAAFEHDFDTMFQNAYTYNQEGSIVYNYAKRMEATFKAAMAEIVTQDPDMNALLHPPANQVSDVPAVSITVGAVESQDDEV